MALSYKTSADKNFVTIPDVVAADLPKYSYSSVLNLDSSIDFVLNNKTAWGVNRDAFVKVNDASVRRVTLNDFTNSNVDLKTSAQAFVDINNAKRGDIYTGTGDDLVEVSVVTSTNFGLPGWGSPSIIKHSTFTVDTGAGADTIIFTLGTPEAGRSVAVSDFSATKINAGDGANLVDMRGSANDLATIDTITSGWQSDTIYGGGGNDSINSGGGHDSVFGGAGDDSIIGGLGNDYIEGNQGNDTLEGSDGNDTIWGGSGNDEIWAGVNNDRVDGGSGNDKIYGQSGDDVIFGRAGDDLIFGGQGNDKISGNTGFDRLYGGDGSGAPGGDGADTFVIGELDTILDDSQPVKTYVYDVIEDFVYADGDVIDVFNPSAWTKEIVGSDTVLHYNTDQGGLLIRGVTDFELSWLV